MTIPRNLSILAEGIDSSGVIDVANGGTGLTSPGTSGNILTSNGTAWVSSPLSATGVASFNTRTGAVSLLSNDVTTALGYTPPTPTGTGASGAWGINITGNAVNVTGTVSATNGGTGLTSPGASGNVLTSNGIGWVSSAPASGSAMTLISTKTVTSGDADINWTGLTGYDKYIIYFQNIVPSSGGYLYMRLGTGSEPTYITSNYYWAGYYASTNGNNSFNSAAGSSGISIGPHINGIYSSGDGVSGYIVFENFLNSNSLDTSILTNSTTQSLSNPAYQTTQTAGYLNSNTTVKTAIQILSIGDILTSGKASLYGLSS